MIDINLNDVSRQNILNFLKDIKNKSAKGMAIMIELGNLETDDLANQEYEDILNSIDNVIYQANEYLKLLLPR